jgi:hypothetical protein
VFDGQSLQLTPVGGVTPPQGFMAEARPDLPYSVVSVPGTTFDYRAARPGRVSMVTGSHFRNVLVTDGGTSDVMGGLSGSAIFDNLGAYLDAVRANNRITKTVVLTCTPASLIVSSGNEANRLAYNDLLRSDHGELGVDVLVDVAAIPELADPADTDYYSDGTHYTQAAATLISELMVTSGV